MKQKMYVDILKFEKFLIKNNAIYNWLYGSLYSASLWHTIISVIIIYKSINHKFVRFELYNILYIHYIT